MTTQLLISRPNARYQQWLALLDNRRKRTALGQIVIQGVRPIEAAVTHGWHVEAVISSIDRPLSPWAQRILELSSPAYHVAMERELLAALDGKDDLAEVVLVATRREWSTEELRLGNDALTLVADRPASPGNLGSLVRSTDALGGHAVFVGGHAVDPWDPRCIRASLGAVFTIPVLTVASPEFVDSLRPPSHVVGLTPDATRSLHEADLTGASMLVVGNERAGLSAAWRARCDELVAIRTSGDVDSLNSAAAGAIALYESRRQRA
ncbi:MAG: TrmH family RNA methyltransferase [Candidatus Dormibacteria bacterium]